jgi:hypothetical protein
MKSDFNGDGKADVRWQNSSAARAIWLMNGITYSSGVYFGTGDVLEDHKLLIVNAWRRSVASGM